jgi:hypothetical protein
MTLRGIGSTALALSAFALLGCTDSPTRPMKAGTSFQTTTGGCNVTSGFIIPEGGQPTTQTSLGSRVADGKSGADVDCTVRSAGGGYQIFGAVQQGMRSFTLDAQVGASTTAGEKFSGWGTVYQFDSPTSTNLQSARDACTITIRDNQDIAKGRVWGSFENCHVSNPGSPGIACEAGGSFVFENCDD